MRKLILKCGYSPGDLVMLTAAIRDLHHWYPGQFQTDVRTACPDIWEHNPYISPLNKEEPGVEEIDCTYPLIDHCDVTPYHCLHGFIEFLNERLDLAIKPTRFKGDIHLSALERHWYSQVHEVTGAATPFWIIAAGGKYDISIKWWETERYQRVVDHFRGRILFVQVGETGHHHPKIEGTIDLRGKTSLRELIRLIYHASGVLCPVTALMHLAAAVPVPPKRKSRRACVVIAGGREPAHWEAYPGHQFIHFNSALKCCGITGCWKDRTFPLRDGDERDGRDSLCVDVVGDLPRCMDMITPEMVIQRIESYFEGGALKYLTHRDVVPVGRGIAATRQNDVDWQSLNLHSAGMACDRFIKRIPVFPGGFHGRGIVICAGGGKYLPCAWVLVHMLRHLGCSLPIQLWHLGKEEVTPEMEALLIPLQVECVNASKLRNGSLARALRGWELKPYSILHSPFHQLLLLDADNVPVCDPSFLFDCEEFRRTGAVFWPDLPHPLQEKAAAIWRSCGLDAPREPEFETGQLLVDKERCWSALYLTMWFNENSDFYYRHLHGDKETFHIAFRRLKKKYHLIKEPVVQLRGTMCQHDPQGRRLFQHRNTAKWELFGDNPKVPDFRHEKLCLGFLSALREAWPKVACNLNGNRRSCTLVQKS